MRQRLSTLNFGTDKCSWMVGVLFQGTMLLCAEAESCQVGSTVFPLGFISPTTLGGWRSLGCPLETDKCARLCHPNCFLFSLTVCHRCMRSVYYVVLEFFLSNVNLWQFRNTQILHNEAGHGRILVLKTFWTSQHRWSSQSAGGKTFYTHINTNQQKDHF